MIGPWSFILLGAAGLALVRVLEVVFAAVGGYSGSSPFFTPSNPYSAILYLEVRLPLILPNLKLDALSCYKI